MYFYLGVSRFDFNPFFQTSHAISWRSGEIWEFQFLLAYIPMFISIVVAGAVLVCCSLQDHGEIGGSSFAFSQREECTITCGPIVFCGSIILSKEHIPFWNTFLLFSVGGCPLFPMHSWRWLFLARYQSRGFQRNWRWAGSFAAPLKPSKMDGEGCTIR